MMAYNYNDTSDKDGISTDFDSIRLTVASQKDIEDWSHGEVLKPETINYRTQKPERDGLFCERIFGPVKDINPHDARFKGTRQRNLAVDKKGALVMRSIVRRERMGHVTLAAPIVHIWFLRVAPSPLAALTNLSVKTLEKVIYFVSYLILAVDDNRCSKLQDDLNKTYHAWQSVLKDKLMLQKEFKQAIFTRLVNESRGKVNVEMNIWKLLEQIHADYAKALKETKAEPWPFAGVRKHQLYDNNQFTTLQTALAALRSIFAEAETVLKTTPVIDLCQKFFERAELDSAFKAEFKKVDKELDTFLSGLTYQSEQLSQLYDVRCRQLINLQQYSLLTEFDYRGLPNDYQQIVRVGMGGEAIYEMLQGIELPTLVEQLDQQLADMRGQKRIQALRRLKILKGILQAGIMIEDFCLTVLPVIPPDLRPIVQISGGRFATTDLNDLYRRVINRNNRLRKLQELHAPEVICRNEKRMLQESVDALIDNSQQRTARVATTGSQQRKLKSLADILKRKQGRLRQNLLGKRVDYSGRSVIVVGSNLTIFECGLPKVMALELFKPFVIGHLIQNDYAGNIRSASRLIEADDPVVWDSLEKVIQGKYVLLNRAPSLHRLSIQAFRPKLIEGKAIQLHPLVCKGFNADFDGDTMAVHLPLSEAAQEEAANLLIVAHNLLHPADGTPILYLDQDIIFGLYYLTYLPEPDAPIKHHFESVVEAIYALEAGAIKLQTLIDIVFRNERLQTTLGRILFHEIFPPDFTFRNLTMTRQAIKDTMAIVYDMYDSVTTVQIADDLKNLAFEHATNSGISIGMSDFIDIDGHRPIHQQGTANVIQINQQYKQGLITHQERYRLIIDNWFNVDKQIQSLVDEQFNQQTDSTLNLIIDSKARSGVNLGQIKRMMASIGVMNDTSGRALELSVNSNYCDGLPILEYFTAARGARKSLVDVALSTSDSGHLTRRLVYVAQDIVTIADDADQVDTGFAIYRADCDAININFAKRLANRYAASDVKIKQQVVVKQGELITSAVAQQIEDSDIASVAIMSCLSAPNLDGIPVKSYGIDLANGELVIPNNPIGVIAAQSIGEPSTQLKLDSKHGGGLAADAQHTVSTGLNRVEELFEARNPKGIAYLAPFDGTVLIKELNYDNSVFLQADADQPFVIDVKDCQVFVKAKDAITEDGLVAVRADHEAVLTPISGTVQSVKNNQILIKPAKPLEMRWLSSKSQELLVQNGQQIKRGDQINEGSLNLEELLIMKGVTATQRYILNAISAVFLLQGTYIADKHLEVIIRQMFSRLKIVDSGDSDFIAGDIISKQLLFATNQALQTAGKRQAVWQQLVLGITRVSTTSDSFLVAATFQDTTRILVNSSINGRVDPLKGLIENVILGRKIPVGLSHNLETTLT